jgi:hypothetical protein
MKKLFMFPLMFLTVIAFSQNWTSEEKEILERVQTGYSSWQDAVNSQDYSIWLNAVNPTDDWRGWWTTDAYLWSTEDTKRNFEFLIKDIVGLKWITVKPIEIQVHDNVAFIWFYAESAIENTKGITKTSVEKRFEVYRKIEGKWRWSAGMVDAKPINNILE